MATHRMNSSGMNVTPMAGFDFVQDGELYQEVRPRIVMVESETDLAELTDVYQPGSIAFTAGYATMWQLSTDGTWVEIGADDDISA